MSRQVCVSFAQNHCYLAYGQPNHQELEVEADVFFDDLKAKVKAFKLIGVETTLVLADGDYQLLKTKKPDVPEQEIKEALLWQEQSRLSLPADQVVLEYIESRGVDNEQQLYVAVVAKQRLQEKYQLAQAAGLKVKKITIPELVYTNYVQSKFANNSNSQELIWANIFSDQPRAFLFSNHYLVATLRLPKIEAGNNVENLEGISNALQLFFHEQVESYCEDPKEKEEIIWVINSSDANLASELENALSENIDNFNASAVFTDLNKNLSEQLLQVLSHATSVAVSHAVLGAVTKR